MAGIATKKEVTNSTGSRFTSPDEDSLNDISKSKSEAAIMVDTTRRRKAPSSAGRRVVLISSEVDAFGPVNGSQQHEKDIWKENKPHVC